MEGLPLSAKDARKHKLAKTHNLQTQKRTRKCTRVRKLQGAPGGQR